jgi:hypothetical protein
MEQTMASLQRHREKLLKELGQIGNFRRGNISVNYRKCGKANCVCSQPKHRGHGPQYLWSTTIKGRSHTKNLKLGPELQKYKEEIDNYHAFQRVCEEIILTSEKICELQPISAVEDAGELEKLKKNLQRHFLKKYEKRLRR